MPHEKPMTQEIVAPAEGGRVLWAGTGEDPVARGKRLNRRVPAGQSREWAHRLDKLQAEKSGADIGGVTMNHTLRRLWQEDEAQDIAEYAVMLAVILVIVVGTIRLIGSNANNVFSSVASSIQ
jgi:Flp pilus assembly pilin Flp